MSKSKQTKTGRCREQHGGYQKGKGFRAGETYKGPQLCGHRRKPDFWW